jgi:Lamin Tail Domain
MKHIIFFVFTTVFFISACTSKIDFEVVPPVPPTVTTELLISEISTAINTDPTASGTRTHYVELYNGTGKSIDLSNYAIGYMAVTDSLSLIPWSFGLNFFILNSTLPTDTCYVIASPQADRAVIKRDTSWGTTSTNSAQANSPLQLSGNSGIALLKKAAGGLYNFNGNTYSIIDVFGSPLVARVGTRGATSARNNIIWTIAGETSDTRNRTFFRKANVAGPNTDWATTKGSTAENSQWIISGDRNWDYTNLGLPTK